MAKEFTDLPAPFCFPKCPNMSLSVDTRFMYADDKLYTSSASITCTHEEACKMWAEQARKKICPECDYNDDQCPSNPIECYPVVRRKTDG